MRCGAHPFKKVSVLGGVEPSVAQYSQYIHHHREEGEVNIAKSLLAGLAPAAVQIPATCSNHKLRDARAWGEIDRRRKPKCSVEL